MNSQEQDSENMETAIEGNEEQRRREKNIFEKVLAGIELGFLMITSETALIVYILIHWMLACSIHMGLNEEDSIAFISFLYFMCTLIAFLSLMSHVSGLLVPLFLFSIFGSFSLFCLINLSVMGTPDSNLLYLKVCEQKLSGIYCRELRENYGRTTALALSAIVFFMTTCAAILFQFTRNEEYFRNPPPALYPHHFHVYHPHPQEVPVGATYNDEPPRYSTLEPIPSPKQASTVTSPPRYSYWERTFGHKNRTTSQSSTDFSVTSPKNH